MCNKEINQGTFRGAFLMQKTERMVDVWMKRLVMREWID